MKLLIVDDQQSIHAYLEKMIAWEAFGITALLHAYDGEEGLSVLARERPAVMLLDIRMPLMSGTEVLCELRRRDLTFVRVIVLSAYGEFEYAKAALRYGAESYLLKPINRKELAEALTSCLNGIRERFSLALREFLLHDEGVAFWDWFPLRGQLVSGLLAKEVEAEPLKADWQVSLPHGMCFLLLRHESPATESSVGAPALPAHWSDATVLSCAALSRPVLLDAPEKLRRCYQQCELAYDWARFYEEEGLTVCRESEEPVDLSALTCFEEALATAALMHGGALNERVSELFARLRTLRADRKQVSAFCLNLLGRVSARVVQARGNDEACDIGSDLYRLVDQCETLKQLQETFEEKLLFDVRDRPPKSAFTQTTYPEVVAYLEERLPEALTLEGIARHFATNKYDLCRNFRQASGKTLWECLTTMRIDRAKCLLTETDMKVYEIGEAVGFNSSTHFSNTFKRATGVRPQQWKNA